MPGATSAATRFETRPVIAVSGHDVDEIRELPAQARPGPEKTGSCPL